MSFLVTGCAGFIGSNFTTALRRLYPDKAIIGIDDFSSGRRELIYGTEIRTSGVPRTPDVQIQDDNFHFYEGCITNGELLDKIFQTHRPQYVFHFAAIPRVSFSVEQPALTTKTNIYGTALLLEKCRDYNVSRFIFSSSSSVYGGADKLPTKESENPPRPISPYALQKYVGELLCQNASRMYGLDTICLRYFNVFGPGQYGDSPYSTVISSWLENLYFDGNPYQEGNGGQSRDFCYVDNVVRANLLAMQSENKFSGQPFNIGGGERTDLIAVKRMIEQLIGRKINLEQRPERKGDVRHTQADVNQAHRWIGYQPSVNFADGLKKTVEWFSSRVSS